jgi:predicted enzyme related to lactoylglutathione lyase
MPERTGYAHGIPCWVDLGTPDLDASKAFYAAVLGWDYQAAGDEYGGYVTATLRGQPVAGMLPTGAGAGGGDVATFPPAWSSYVAVDDADATTKLAADAGAQVLVEPMDITDVGRMAFVLDPTGAAIGLWQAGQHFGAGIVNEPGAYCWNELVTSDIPAAADFYAAVFGWQTQTVPAGDGPDYTMFATGPEPEDGIAGALNPPMAGIPPYWAVYFAVADLDAALEQATGLGASPVAPPIDTAAGRISPMVDPQGIAVNFIQLAPPAG